MDIEINIINNKVYANFGNGINSLKAFYNIEVAAMVHLKYSGIGTFRMKYRNISTPQMAFKIFHFIKISKEEQVFYIKENAPW